MANKYPLPNGTTLTTDNFNDAPRTLELMMQAVDSDISSSTDYEQNASLLTTYINAADFFEDTGTANTYNLIADSGRYEVYENINGGLIRFRPLNANTGASTISVSGQTAVNLLTEGGTPLTGGELSPNKDAYVRYNGTAYLLLNTGLQSQVETNAADIAILQGLVIPSSATTQGLSYLATKVNLTYTSPTSFTYSVVNDDSKEVITNGTINLATVGVDGLDVGALAINTTYHIFEIKNLTSNIVRTITSTSLASPTLPSGFTKKKHIFSFITNASAQLRPMIIDIDGIVTYEGAGIQDLTAGNLTANGATIQQLLTIPTGIKCDVKLNVVATNEKAIFFLNGNSTFVATSVNGANFGVQSTSNDQDYYGQISVRSNILGQIRITSWNLSAVLNAELSIYTQSYKIIL